VHSPAAIRQPLGRLGRDIFGIQAIAGASFGFELRPQLADFQAFRNAPPEIPQTQAQRRILWDGLSGGRGSGGHETRIIEESASSVPD